MDDQNGLYTDLPQKAYSLKEFNSHAWRLHDQQNVEEFVKFALTGEVPGDHQAVVDPFRDILNPEHPITVSRDYDSILGITEDIAVQCSLCIFPINNPVEALRTSIHLKRDISDGQVTISIPYHKIPNIKLGFWGSRYSIHIFFPLLALNERQSPLLSEDEIATFYEKGLRPYIETVQHEKASDWPANFDSEKFRAAKNTGQMAFRTVILSSWLVRDFANELRQELELNDVGWAKDFFFLHTIRGTKHATDHKKNREAAHLALEEWLQEAHIPTEATESGSWWIDVGLEIHNDAPRAHCLQWMTASHHRLVGNALRIAPAVATRITTLGSSKYSRDIASHLPGVSGFRIEPGRRAEGPYQVAYLQSYTTDKSVTYHPHGRSHAKEVTIRQAMGKEQPVPFLLDLYGAYEEAAKNISSNARLEARVPFRFAKEVLIDVDENIFLESLFSFSTRQWWYFRAYRLLGISNALMIQGSGPPKFRVKREALLLTAACVWLVNGLHARPDDGPSSRSLMKAVLPLTDDDDHLVLAHIPRGRRVGGDDDDGADENESDGEEFDAGTPCYPYGAIFLRRIMVGNIESIPVPRMRGQSGSPFLSPAAFQYLFKKSEEEIQQEYSTVGILPSNATRSKRPSNKARCTPTYATQVTHDGAPEPALFDLAERGYRLPPPPVDDGSDNESEVDPGDGAFGSRGINQDITRLWRQFLVDVLHKSPNPRGAGSESYCKLTPAQRLEVQEDVYKSTDLSQVWNACQWRVARNNEWERAFGHLFPPVGHETPGNVQNYRQCLYYRYWKQALDDADKDSAEAIRQSIKDRVSGLAWLPDAAQDKMWPTSVAGRGRFNRYPPGSTGPAPRIILREEPVL